MKHLLAISLFLVIACGTEYLDKRSYAKPKHTPPGHVDDNTVEPTPTPESPDEGFVPSENSNELIEFNPRPGVYCYYVAGHPQGFSCVFVGGE